MLDCTGESDVWYFYHLDGLGSVVALSNTSGSIVEKYTYDMFGTQTIALDGSTGNPCMFIWSLTFDLFCGIMHRIIKDKATPKTGGLTNRVQKNTAQNK